MTVEILASDRFHSTYDVVMNVYTTEGSTTELLVVAPDGAKIASDVDSGTAADDDPYAWSKLSHEARVTADDTAVMSLVQTLVPVGPADRVFDAVDRIAAPVLRAASWARHASAQALCLLAGA